MASRRRLGQLLGKIDQNSVPVFLTVTIPAWACPTPDELARMLAVLRHRFARRYPDGALVLKREHHRSGVPHLHALVWTGLHRSLHADVVDLRRWLPTAWAEVLGVRSRVEVEAARNCRKVQDYVSGYLWRGKGYQLDARGIHWGRWWWVWQPENLPVGEAVVEVLDDPAVYGRLRRAARKAGKLGRRVRNGVPTTRFLSDNPADWQRLAEFYSGLDVAADRSRERRAVDRVDRLDRPHKRASNGA